MGTTRDRVSYFCLSDFHSGALSSILTPLDDNFDYDPSGSSASATTFGTAIGATLQSLIGDDAPPDFIMLGDALDMSFSPPDRSSDVLCAALKSIYGTPGTLSNQMMFLPGNHDHALWTAERFHGRAENGPTDGFRHVTDAFQAAETCPKSRILEQVVSPLNLDIKVPTYYPNMGLTNSAGDRALVLHHGHFTEATYRLMNKVVAVLSGRDDVGQDVQTLEELNGNWIDFGWSTIGSGGILGTDVTVAYHNLLTGTGTTKFQQRIAEHLAHVVAQRFGLPPTKMIEEGLAIAARGIVESMVGTFSQVERYAFNAPLSEGSIETLTAYLANAVLPQMEAELGGAVPERTTFVFGHTHKPFEDQMVVDGFAAPVGIYNTGGWVLDTALLSTVEGASAVFIDEDLNTAAIKLFGMPMNGQPTGVSVVSADIDQGGGNNPLLERLGNAVDAHADLWSAFSDAVATDLMTRQGMLLNMSRKSEDDARRTGGLL